MLSLLYGVERTYVHKYKSTRVDSVSVPVTINIIIPIDNNIDMAHDCSHNAVVYTYTYIILRLELTVSTVSHRFFCLVVMRQPSSHHHHHSNLPGLLRTEVKLQYSNAIPFPSLDIWECACVRARRDLINTTVPVLIYSSSKQSHYN